MATKHYLNLNYVCNEHCVFCASNLTNNLKGTGIRKELTLQQVRAWIDERPPRRDDEVLLGGGEPTLHKDFFAIVQEFGAHCKDIKLFTNALKLADESYARGTVAAGVTGFEIALFGATPATHDAITQRPNSFNQTITALKNLLGLRERRRLSIVVRLLVAQHCYTELPAIVRAVHRLAPGVDKFSLNRLILSERARASDAMVSWSEAAAAINKAATLIRRYGYNLWFWPVPLCVFDEDNASFVDAEVRRYIRRGAVRPNFRYLDPVVASRKDVAQSPPLGARAAPDVCQRCQYKLICGGVEDWHYTRFGTEGLGLKRRASA
jgi:MoaA/NifB/PqqE/SkfB family radical SAM enzyme